MKVRTLLATIAIILAAGSAFGQVTPAAGFTPPDDNPSFALGATIYADYTYIQSPTVKDADGNVIHNSSFNIGRAYINATGKLNHWISYRITPDISRETGTGSSLNGSYTFRLKYAYATFALDDWTTHGSWVRFGVQQTPYLDYSEGIYRYRFQGTMFPERVGLITSSDAGLTGRWVFPGNYGDVHGGFYNGEGYSRAETNNEKAFQIRGTVRPLPLGGIWKGLRLTGFAVEDHYVQGAKRQRFVEQATFEHPLVNAGFDLVQARDRTLSHNPVVEGSGWGFWATPKLGTKGWEALLRHDDYKPNKGTGQRLKRDILGIAYWVPNLNKVTTAFLIDYDKLHSTNFTPARADDTRYGLKMLIIY